MKVERGEIWLAQLPNGIGSEQCGRKPVIILQNNTGNLYAPTTIVAIITSKQFKKSLPTHVIIPDSIGMHLPSIILCEQIMVLDVDKRLEKKIGFIDDMSEVDCAVRVSLGLE